MQALKLMLYEDTPENNQRIEAYSIHEDDYAVHPKITLEQRRNLPDNHLIMILEQDNLVGFFCLDTVGALNEYGGREEDLLFRSFSIDHRFRNRRYAESAMYALDHFASTNFSTKKNILLVVNYANIPAQRLYEKCGYHDTGRRADGLYGEVYVYLKKIPSYLPS